MEPHRRCSIYTKLKGKLAPRTVRDLRVTVPREVHYALPMAQMDVLYIHQAKE